MEVARSSETMVAKHTCTQHHVEQEWQIQKVVAIRDLYEFIILKLHFHFTVRKSNFSFWQMVRGNFFENILERLVTDYTLQDLPFFRTMLHPDCRVIENKMLWRMFVLQRRQY
jgi:hypothetical protein